MFQDKFQFSAYGVTLTVEPLPVPSGEAYRISFSSNRMPLIIARAKGADGNYFWTSIPEGRQPEAEGVGRLLEEQLKKK